MTSAFAHNLLLQYVIRPEQHLVPRVRARSMSAFVVLLLLSVSVTAQYEQRILGFEHTSIGHGKSFDARRHMPGTSPYFDAQGFGLDDEAPLGCNVTAASYLIRHAAIYANDNDYESFMDPWLQKLNSSADWTGPLSFLKTWKSPITDPDKQLEQITPSGANDSTKVGKVLLQRYPNLVPTTRIVYADKKSRTQDSAKALIKAFSQHVEVVEITEDEEFHAVIPHKFCPKFTKKAGDKEFELFVGHYTAPILSRLRPFAPAKLLPRDIVAMQHWCGYESAITGKESELCGVFTPTEWMGYEYAWDLKYNYMVGHGNPLSPYLGFPWLNVTSELFEHIDTPSHSSRHNATAPMDQKFFVSFTHREVPPFIATALGLFNSTSSTAESMPTDRINFGRSWKMAELIPFLGHIGIEKLTCDASSGAMDGATEFVRIVANSAPRPIPQCQDGPGASCLFENFKKFVTWGMKEFGDFHGVCGEHKKR